MGSPFSATSTAWSLRTRHSPKGANNATYQTCAFRWDQDGSVKINYVLSWTGQVRSGKTNCEALLGRVCTLAHLYERYDIGP